jgi:hypothetical protein
MKTRCLGCLASIALVLLAIFLLLHYPTGW